MPAYFVKPKEPTVLSHKEYHQISSTNLFVSSIVPTAIIIPEILDIEKFNIALGNALSIFPHFVGRLVRPDTPDDPWAIRLTNSGVPVTLIDSEADEIVPKGSFTQTPFRLVERLNVAGIITTEGESDEPLFRLTITRFVKLNSTLLGACFWHGLSDGIGIRLFFGTLSQFYQGVLPADPLPYYEPEAIKFPDPLNAPSAVLSRYDPLGRHPCELPERRVMEFVALRLTATQLAEIHGTVTQGKEHLKISRGDVVVGLLARCLSEVEPESKPIDTVLNVVDHRGMGIYPTNAVLNAIFWLPTRFQNSKGVDPHGSVLACATEIRESLKRLKDPEFVKDMAAGLAKSQSEVAWDKMGQDHPSAKEGCMIVNNGWNIKRDQTSWHFGHPNRVIFHQEHPPGPRYIRITSPNPLFVDDSWISREGGMEVTLYVPPGRKRRFERIFEGYAKGLGITGSVEFLFAKLARL